MCVREVDVNNAGEGQLEIMINKGTVPNSVRMLSTGVFQVSFVPKEPKPHTVDIKFNSTPLPGTSTHFVRLNVKLRLFDLLPICCTAKASADRTARRQFQAGLRGDVGL